MGTKTHSQRITNSRKRGLEARSKKLQDIIEAAKRFGVEDYITIRLDSKAPALTAGFHEIALSTISQNSLTACSDSS